MQAVYYGTFDSRVTLTSAPGHFSRVKTRTHMYVNKQAFSRADSDQNDVLIECGGIPVNIDWAREATMPAGAAAAADPQRSKRHGTKQSG